MIEKGNREVSPPPHQLAALCYYSVRLFHSLFPVTFGLIKHAEREKADQKKQRVSVLRGVDAVFTVKKRTKLNLIEVKIPESSFEQSRSA